ncbi:MAG: SGNH/GDSL hydrolase family protein [Symploca sp. SIO1C2]|nr:SGNH/GDSL hydrolase family protein [Symploca sp. SIO1C2]
MFKSRRSLYYRKHNRKPLPLMVIIAAIPLVLIILELLAWLIVNFTGNGSALLAYKGEPAEDNAYRLKFLGQNQQPYDGILDKGSLAVYRNLAGGYSLVGDQQSDFWRINEQGFRDDDPIPLAKPQDEIRIFLLGGSTAFGQRNASNQATIASKLETRLNQRIDQQRRSPEKYRPTFLPVYRPELIKALAKPPKIKDGQYRVINSAVPGYTSGNELAQLALQILPYSPDAIIVLDGYTDLMLPSNQQETTIPKTEAFLNNAPGHFWTHITQQWKNAIAQTHLIKAIQKWLFRPEPSISQRSLVVNDETLPLEQHLAPDEAELKQRIARYRNHHQQMIRLTTGAGIPLVVAIQPEITGYEQAQMSPQEQELVSKLGTLYQKQLPIGYAELIKASQGLEKAFPKNIKVLNFYNLFKDIEQKNVTPKVFFTDAVHLTEEANQVISERYYQALTAQPKLQVTPPKKP